MTCLKHSSHNLYLFPFHKCTVQPSKPDGEQQKCNGHMLTRYVS